MPYHHQGQPTRLDVLGNQVLTVSTTAVSLTIPSPGTVIGVFLEVQDAPVRWYCHGGAPTATSGHYLAAGDTAMLFINPVDMRFIRDTAATGDAKLIIDYLGV